MGENMTFRAVDTRYRETARAGANANRRGHSLNMRKKQH